jgi:hypothetical protein
MRIWLDKPVAWAGKPNHFPADLPFALAFFRSAKPTS